jgi:hypothetical protein
MESIWTLANVDELEFAATSKLLDVKAKKRSIVPAEQIDDESSDEDEPEEDEEDCATARPSSRLATCQHGALTNKFLDRLAELFSREKSSPGCRSRQDAKHVAATAWINPDYETGEALMVIVAKNEGLDDRDVRMLVRLQEWLRDVAATGRVQSAQNDKLWTGNEGLVEFSRSRLWYCVSWLKKNAEQVTDLATLCKDTAAQVTQLQCLYRDINKNSTTQDFCKIVDAAYSLRSTWKTLLVPEEHTKAIRTINMIGRLRAAYECFKFAALTFDMMAGLEMRPVSRRQADQSAALRLHVHAEMQILVSLAQNPNWYGRAHPYIGVSKKLCFLCDQILRNYDPLAGEVARSPTFRARQCHGKVYPLWTLPQCVDIPENLKRSLARSVTITYHQMRLMLQQKLPLQPAIAESSVGLTNPGSVSAHLAPLRDQHLIDGRPLASPQASNESEQPTGLGRKIKTVKVGRLPADGSDPDLLPIAFHALPKTTNVKMFEFGKDYVPDFHDAWDTRQFDRRYRNITFEDQPCKDWNGEYRLYWNENPTLSINETVKAFLKIEGEVEPMRRFWYGDVFLVRYSEQPITCDFDVHDLPFTIAEYRWFLEQLFQGMWEDKYLEAQLEEDRYFKESLAKSEADKAIISQRMYVAVVPFFHHDVVKLTSAGRHYSKPYCDWTHQAHSISLQSLIATMARCEICGLKKILMTRLWSRSAPWCGERLWKPRVGRDSIAVSCEVTDVHITFFREPNMYDCEGQKTVLLFCEPRPGPSSIANRYF